MSDLIEAWVLAERHVVLQDLAPTRQRAPKAPQEITDQSFLRFENTLCRSHLAPRPHVFQ